MERQETRPASPINSEQSDLHQATPHSRLNIAVLCSDDPHHLYLVGELSRRFGLVGIVLERNRVQRRRLWQKKRYRDWLYRWYHACRHRIMGQSRYREEFFLSQMPGRAFWPDSALEVDWINQHKAQAAIARWRPDVTVVCGTGIVRRSILAHTGLTINIHGGLLPDYKGNQCIFFAFYEREFDRIGSTLHLVTKDLDSGPILALVRPPIYPHDNDETLYCRSVHLAMQRLFELLEDMSEGRQPRSQPQPPAGRVFRHRDRKPHLDLSLWVRRWLGLFSVPCMPNLSSPARRGRWRPSDEK